MGQEIAICNIHTIGSVLITKENFVLLFGNSFIMLIIVHIDFIIVTVRDPIFGRSQYSAPMSNVVLFQELNTNVLSNPTNN